MQQESLHMQALLLLLKRLAKSNLSMRSHLRISIYMNREMFLCPIPNRGKDISSINTLEFLLRKHYRGIMSCVPYGKCHIRNQKRNNQNFSAVIFHYLNSPLPFHQKELSLHRTIIFFSIILP